MTTMRWPMSLFGVGAQDGVFTRGYVSHTAQGLNASLTHPCPVNTEAMCWCVCVCVFRLLVHRVYIVF